MFISVCNEKAVSSRQSSLTEVLIYNKQVFE